MNKNSSITIAVIMSFLVISLSSCEAIAGIFKAGMWVGVIGVVLLVIVIFWLINKVRRK